MGCQAIQQFILVVWNSIIFVNQKLIDIFLMIHARNVLHRRPVIIRFLSCDQLSFSSFLGSPVDFTVGLNAVRLTLGPCLLFSATLSAHNFLGQGEVASIALHCIALHWTVHCTALHYTALHCTALHCTALNCTALQCTAMHCNARHCNALN